MGNSNNYKYVNEEFSNNIDYSKNQKSLHSFELILYCIEYNSEENKKLRDLKKIDCKLKYYPDIVRIKKDNNILYEFTYYEIISWAHGKDIFVLDTKKDNKELKFIFKTIKSSGKKCVEYASSIKQICNSILEKNNRDKKNILE